jgi:phage baseplate assembly protein W
MADLNSPSVGLDRFTGGTVTGWDHVVQSIGDIFTTPFGERIAREWYGSLGLQLLGRQMNTPTIVRFFTAMTAALEAPFPLGEPRFKVTQITPTRVERTGRFYFRFEGEYRPRALLGDFSVEGARRIDAYINSERIEVVS